MRVVVLGAAAGGGVPQWNCNCRICSAARLNNPGLQSTQASIAVSADDHHWFLINASPDLRQQMATNPQLHPQAGHLRHSPLTGVILTNGEVDAVAGLLSLREGWPFTIYAHPRVLEILKANSIFNVLDEARVPREPIAFDAPFEPALPDGSASGLVVTPFAVSGKSAWYLENEAGDRIEEAGDTLGLRVADKASGAHFYFLAACAAVDEELKDRLRGAPLIFFDGTLWRDDELIAAGLGHKTGQRMGHIAMSGQGGAMAALADLGITRKIFLHINNSNPAWLHGSAERNAVDRAGWEIPSDGMEIVI
ncbi:pyrroloquinoline quinone biosynthesis protein PqqB [Afipia sp. Root123D2]|uniref:pyrroloquinoline quinone biosynthesis protein PqqB n=1 Tax=Afipia sp. Root123D2 TaxID=1736436 RepID=UPI0009EBAC86|nr:pyrroloquinoline quinone biosynthesis protein PqqB [Afipia sp. Root123D2]